MRPYRRVEIPPAHADPLDVLAAIPAVRSDPRALLAIAELRGRIATESGDGSLRFAQTEMTGGSLDLSEVLHNVLAAAATVTSAERAFLLLHDGSLASHPGDEAEDYAAGPSHTIVDRVFATGEAVYTTDAQSDPRWNSHHSIAVLHLRSIACVPLREPTPAGLGETIGVIYLDSRVIPGLFTPYDRELLDAFSTQAARAIASAHRASEERARVERVAALQAFQSRILETIASGVITLDFGRRITSFNAGAEKLFGVSASAMLGGDVGRLSALVPDFGELFGTFIESDAAHLRAEATGINAKRRHELALEVRLWPLADRDGPGVAIVLADVTKHRTLEVAHAEQIVRADQVTESFSRYLAPHVVETLMKDPASIRLGGERTPATMLFADVRGFTQLASTAQPERVVEILNAYFEEAVKVIFEHDGLLDKFYGDGLMAVFGPPRVRADDAERAIRAAVHLHHVVRRLGPELDYALEISVGIATGDVIAGHFGSLRRMDYTVIGDAVNLASGLQSAAPRGMIYCDEATFRRAGKAGATFRRIDATVKGRRGTTGAYAVT